MIRLLLLTLLPALALGEITIPRLPFQQRTLENGLRVIWLEDHAAPVAAVQVWYHVGSKDDPPGRSGFAHLFEHMMFKSTKRMPSEALDRLTEDVGGENNAFTADDVTVYHEDIPSNHLERLLWAEAERMSSLIVDRKNFLTERDVVKEEFRQRILAEPYGQFGEFIQKRSFKQHPYKRPTIGNIEELDASSLAEVQSFHATFYRPDNATLIVVGDFESGQLNRWIDQYFGPLQKPQGEIPRVSVREPERTAAELIREHDPKVPFPALALTFLGPKASDPESAAWQVLERVLAGGDSSRLFRSLVYEQQLAQQVEFYADLREDLGLPTFRITLASGVSVDRAREAVLAEIDLLMTKPVPERELRTAKNQLLAAQLAERERASGKAHALGEAALLRGDPERANEDLKRIQEVSAEQLQSIAARVFAEKNRLLIEYLPASADPKSSDDK